MSRAIALLTIGDGRDDLLAATLDSLAHALDREPGDVLGAFTCHVHVDDRRHRLGFCGAIAEGWRRLRELDGWEYVLHVEEDWRFTRALNLDAMGYLLECQPDLVQIALRRNPVAPAELAAGGVVELWPEQYADRALGELRWLEHVLFFTTNPSLYRRDLLGYTWPSSAPGGCEAQFGERLKADGWRFAYWGERSDPPWVEHTGTIRTGRGY